MQTLVIRSLTLKDGGVYTCKIGDRHTDAALSVSESKPTPRLLSCSSLELTINQFL